MKIKGKKYYSLTVGEKEASIYIYGDIVSWEWFESDVSSYTLAKEIEALSKDITAINVFINSYGGEVAEGLAIYNSLKRHPAKIRTHCDGFACSIASVVFMAGDERIMSNASLLMIHNAWIFTIGDHNQLRKDADDMETITQASVNAYMEQVSITEEELKAMLDAETWLSAADALEKGFATEVVEPPATVNVAASLRLREQVAEAILQMKRASAPVKGPSAEIHIDGETLRQMFQQVKAEILAELAEPDPPAEPGTGDPLADPAPSPEPAPNPEPGPDDEPGPEPAPEQKNKLQSFIATLVAAERSV
ncbi:MAG: ATP-dependent Clp protease proteolytic subunit [Bacillota bacterium]|nr:ATP-dependent Clp protease proteolytic subunit [Bacillota bacterium]